MKAHRAKGPNITLKEYELVKILLDNKVLTHPQIAELVKRSESSVANIKNSADFTDYRKQMNKRYEDWKKKLSEKHQARWDAKKQEEAAKVQPPMPLFQEEEPAKVVTTTPDKYEMDSENTIIVLLKSLEFNQTAQIEVLSKINTNLEAILEGMNKGEAKKPWFM